MYEAEAKVGRGHLQIGPHLQIAYYADDLREQEGGGRTGDYFSSSLTVPIPSITGCCEVMCLRASSTRFNS